MLFKKRRKSPHENIDIKITLGAPKKSSHKITPLKKKECFTTNPVFTTGETVEGVVTLSLHSNEAPKQKFRNSPLKYTPIKMNSLKIVLIGKEVVYEDVYRGFRMFEEIKNGENEKRFLSIPYNLVDYNRYKTPKKPVKKKKKREWVEKNSEKDEQVNKKGKKNDKVEDIDEEENGEILCDGKYEFPFLFKIPKWCPGSVDVPQVGKVRWLLKCVMKCNYVTIGKFSLKEQKKLLKKKKKAPVEGKKPFEFSVKKVREIVVKKGSYGDGYISMIYPRKIEKSTKIYTGLYKRSKKGSVLTYKINIDSVYIQKGEVFLIRIKLDNGSKKKIKKTKVFLERVTNIFKNGEMCFVNKKKKINSITYKCGVGSNSSEEHVLKYKIDEQDESVCSNIIYGSEDDSDGRDSPTSKSLNLEKSLIYSQCPFPPKYQSSVIQYGELLTTRYKLFIQFDNVVEEFFKVFIVDKARKEGEVNLKKKLVLPKSGNRDFFRGEEEGEDSLVSSEILHKIPVKKKTVTTRLKQIFKRKERYKSSIKNSSKTNLL